LILDIGTVDSLVQNDSKGKCEKVFISQALRGIQRLKMALCQLPKEAKQES
jgi:hypothetical protein